MVKRYQTLPSAISCGATAGTVEAMMEVEYTAAEVCRVLGGTVGDVLLDTK